MCHSHLGAPLSFRRVWGVVWRCPRSRPPSLLVITAQVPFCCNFTEISCTGLGFIEIRRLYGPCTGLPVALRGEEESRPALALTFTPGYMVALTAPLPFACGRDGGCSNRSDTHTVVAVVLRVIGAPPRTCGIRARARLLCLLSLPLIPTCRRRRCQSEAVGDHAINPHLDLKQLLLQKLQNPHWRPCQTLRCRWRLLGLHTRQSLPCLCLCPPLGLLLGHSL